MERMDSQTTDTLVMIRPARFGFNNETSASNIFQNNSADEKVESLALKEFDLLVKKLREKKIFVIILQDDELRSTPDSIFPNNWISFHGKKMVLYPMLAENRRRERKRDWVEVLKYSFGISEVKDFSPQESNGKFLEGTGSLVLDRKNKIAFANLSSRTNLDVLQQWCSELNYRPVYFTSKTTDGKEIYHTNVLMSIGEKVAVICSEVIRDETERLKILEELATHHTVAEISESQMMHFAVNMLLVKNREGKRFWVMSEQAFTSLTTSQKELLQQDGECLTSDLKTIETVGGGSARCMLAEIF